MVTCSSHRTVSLLISNWSHRPIDPFEEFRCVGFVGDIGNFGSLGVVLPTVSPSVS